MHVGADTQTEIEKDPDLKQLISKAKNAQDSVRILKEYNSTATPLIKLDEDSYGEKRRVSGFRYMKQIINPLKPMTQCKDYYRKINGMAGFVINSKDERLN